MQITISLRLAKFILGLSLALLGILAYLSYLRLQNLMEYNDLVEDTNLLNYKVVQSMSYLKDAETGSRGYLLSKDTAFLQPYKIAEEELNKIINELNVLPKNDPDIAFLIKNYAESILTRLNYLTKIINNDNIESDYSDKDKPALMKGKRMMDDVRKEATFLNKKIGEKLALRQKIKEKYSKATPLFIIILSVVALGFLLIAYRIITAELNKRKIVQQQLEYNNQALIRSNQELEQFAYVASHDLQEPLRKIQTFGSRLSSNYNNVLDEDGNFMITRMQSAASRMQILINDLLSYSRLTYDFKTQFIDVNLHKAIANVTEILSEVIASAQAQIIVTGKLPVIHGNQIQLEQLFQNLFSNAIKFVKPDNQPVIHVSASQVLKDDPAIPFAGRGKKFYCIKVQDNGIGFDQQYAEKIFVIFQRLQGKLEYSGTGIGLALCMKIANNHGGFIVANSTPGLGAEFLVYLPTN